MTETTPLQKPASSRQNIRNLVGWPALQLDADASRCIDCQMFKGMPDGS